MNFSKVLAQLSAEADAEKAPPILPEALVARLREFGDRYAEMLRGPRFAVGDLITPTPDSDIKAAEGPDLVVEIRDAEPDFGTGTDGSTDYGARCDIRICRFLKGYFRMIWAESVYFERWTPPKGEQAPANGGAP